VRRGLLVLAAGLIGLLLGVGLSLVADAIAGDEISDPIPAWISTETERATPTGSPRHDRPEETASPTHDANDHEDGGAGSHDDGGAGSQEDGGGGSDDDGSDGGSEGPEGDDD
jgi:hypothetical protein